MKKEFGDKVKLVKESENKAERVLSIYSKLKQGKIIFKAEESDAYGVALRTIQRDIDDIKCFLQNQGNKTGEVQKVVYNKLLKGYVLKSEVQSNLEPKELLAVCKVLLESRSLTKEEMFPMINKIINICSGDEEKKLLSEYVSNEMHHFVELRHCQKLLDKLWELARAVKEQRCIEIQYTKTKNNETVIRKIKPVGIMFSEFYYYLAAYIDDINKEEVFRNPNDTYPTLYRIDRFKNIEVLDEHFRVPYHERFEEGEFRKRIQFMYGGRLRKIKLKYKGNSLDSVLDRLPTAQINKKESDGIVIQAEVFGDGIDMWLRSQGDLIEII